MLFSPLIVIVIKEIQEVVVETLVLEAIVGNWQLLSYFNY